MLKCWLSFGGWFCAEYHVLDQQFNRSQFKSDFVEKFLIFFMQIDDKVFLTLFFSYIM